MHITNVECVRRKTSPVRHQTKFFVVMSGDNDGLRLLRSANLYT